MSILTEPKFYPKNEYNEKATVSFLVNDASFHNSFEKLARKHFENDELFNEDVSYEIQICVYDDLTYDAIIHYWSSDIDYNEEICELIPFSELDVVQVNDIRDAIEEESLNIRKEFDSYNLATQVEQFMFDRKEYDRSPEEQTRFICDKLEEGEKPSDNTRVAVRTSLTDIIKGNDKEDDIGSVMEYLNEEINNIDIESELYETAEDLLAKLDKFDEVYNSLDKKDKDIERE